MMRCTYTELKSQPVGIIAVFTQFANGENDAERQLSEANKNK